MINLLIIGLCLLAGLFMRRQNKLPLDSYKAINAWLIYLALPAVSFKYLPHINISSNLVIPAIAPIIVWSGGWIYTRYFAQENKLPKPTEGSMKLSSGLSNTSFLGFPLVAAYFGDAQIGIAIICDQITFLLLSTAAIIVGINASGAHRLSFAVVLKKVLAFPALPACVGALVLPHFVSLRFFEPMFHVFAATVAPLALFSIGMQLDFSGWRQEWKLIRATLLYKLLIAPLLVLCLVLLLRLKGMEVKVAIFEMSMPTLVSSAIVAGEYRLNPKLSSLIIGIGILMCFVTTAIWYFVLQMLF